MVTLLPAPDQIIKKLLKWGTKSKQVCLAGLTMEFLNRHKHQFSWDDGAPVKDEGLLEHSPSDGLLDELPALNSKPTTRNCNLWSKPC